MGYKAALQDKGCSSPVSSDHEWSKPQQMEPIVSVHCMSVFIILLTCVTLAKELKPAKWSIVGGIL